MTSKTSGITTKANLITLALICGSFGCGRNHWPQSIFGNQGKKHEPVVTVLATQAEHSPAASEYDWRFAAADDRATKVQATAASTALSGTVTFRKDGLFNRDFLYGFDLQYTSGADTKLSLIPQAQSLGHVPCFFRQLGDELQLVADQTRLFESNINHPELLISTYKVLKEDDETLTVKFASGGLAINEAVNGKGADAPKQVWLRSLDFVADGEYLLQESALLLKDGSIQTYMESVFPRANLVPEGYKGLEANPANEALAERYRFIATENVYVTKSKTNGVPLRVQTTYANRFNIADDKTIDWYVTPNAPDELTAIFKSGVEGWNRYFTPQQGRPVMRFMGRLPAGIKIGDPRYNVINFDSVAQAGAAYESQAVDPYTGLQSHSLIYMPYAWYNIGSQLWKQRTGESDDKPSEAQVRARVAPKAPEVMFGPGHRVLSCVRAMDEVSLTPDLLASAISEEKDSPGGAAVPVPRSVDEFARRLMMATIFHEVGHSLGMSHNFKGSLTFDSSQEPSEHNPVTSSIMDYNFYQNEQSLFTDIGGTDGPILEYDRQVISQLYNSGKDVKVSDQVVPACDDAEADATVGGVDPLCLRYDTELNPIVGLRHSHHNVTAATGGEGVESKTLTEALLALRAPIAAKFAESVGKPTSPAEAVLKATKLGDQVGDLVNYYLSAGAQALRNNVANNGKALRVWNKNVKLDDEAGFRREYAQILTEVTAWRALPDAPSRAIKSIRDIIKDTVKRAARTNTLAAAGSLQSTSATQAAEAFSAAVDTKVTGILSKLRTSIYGTLKYDEKNLFALSLSSDGDLPNFEDLAFSTLTAGLVVGLDGDGDHVAAEKDERLAAAAALVTYLDVVPDFDAAQATLAAKAAAARAAGDARLLASVREVQQVLKK